jgi:hypothetical protein
MTLAQASQALMQGQLFMAKFFSHAAGPLKDLIVMPRSSKSRRC